MLPPTIKNEVIFNNLSCIHLGNQKGFDYWKHESFFYVNEVLLFPIASIPKTTHDVMMLNMETSIVQALRLMLSRLAFSREINCWKLA